MTSLIGIGGSLRRASYNSGLLRAARELMPAGSTLEIHGIAGIPLYDADEEAAHGIPPPVRLLQDRLAQADGLVIATPEYNNGIPGVVKNAIDWMSRPPAEIGRVFAGKPVALIGASPGGFGTVLSQAAWLPVLRYLKMAPWFGQMLLVSSAGKLFDEAGDLTDQPTRDKLRDYLAAFVGAVEGDGA